MGLDLHLSPTSLLSSSSHIKILVNSTCKNNNARIFTTRLLTHFLAWSTLSRVRVYSNGLDQTSRLT
jgi:hypothetical protein